MPTYSYRCVECAKEMSEVRRIAERDDCPKCNRCYGPTERRITATMVSVFQPYQAVAGEKDGGKKPVIRTKKEHEAFLRRNGYEEVGNDKSMAPPHPEELTERKQRWKDAPDAPMVDVEKLKREGWLQEDITV